MAHKFVMYFGSSFLIFCQILFSAPSSFERYFREELPPLYEYLQEAPIDKVSHGIVSNFVQVSPTNGSLTYLYHI